MNTAPHSSACSTFEVTEARHGLYGALSRRVTWLGLTLLLLGGSALSKGSSASSASYLEGKLILNQSGGPAIQAAKRTIRLSARTSYLLHTLEDKRLANRTVRLEGEMKPDGTFKVATIFTVHDGKLYRIRYYCEVCNIVALEPGNCVCCQQPTELQEIPPDEDQ